MTINRLNTHEHYSKGEGKGPSLRSKYDLKEDKNQFISHFMVNKLEMISARQCEAARGWLSWTRNSLAEASSVAERTIARFETGSSVPNDRTLQDIKRAFEDAGIEFLFEGARAVGIRVS